MTRPDAPDIPGGRVLPWMLAILALGCLLRVWGIEKESAWWDEYSSLVHLKEPGLLAFLSANRTYDPATLPLYYSIEYLWSRVFGDATPVMRIPSILLGLATIPAAYWLGWRILSRRAGLLVAAMVAFSPIHIFHAQGIRMYVLFTLLAVLSMLTYKKLRDEGGRANLAMHAFVQLLLSWTHPFAVLLPVVQGLAWLVEYPAARGAMLRWGAATAIAWLPALIYLSTVRYYPQDISNWMVLPDWRGLFHDLFQDDLPRTGYQVHVSSQAWDWLPLGFVLKQWIGHAVDGLFTAIILGVFALQAALLFRGGEQRKRALLLLLWAVLPVLLLLLASHLFRPMIAPRYTVHCSIAIYLMLAAAAAWLPGRLRLAAELGLCALMLGQASLMYPGPQRTNYLGAARLIAESANPETDMLVVTSQFEYNTLMYNAAFGALPVLHVEGTIPAQLVAAASVLNSRDERSVWIFHVIPYWPKHPDPHPSESFPRLGAEHKLWDVSGMQGVQVTRVWRGASEEAGGAVPEAAPGLLAQIEAGPVSWVESTFSQTPRLPEEQRMLALRHLCGVVQWIGPSVLGLLCGGDMNPARARAVAFAIPIIVGEVEMGTAESRALLVKAVESDAAFGLGHVLLGIHDAFHGDPESGLRQLEHACAVDAEVGGLLRAWVQGLRAGDTAAIDAAIEEVRSLMPDFADTMRELGRVFNPLMPNPEANMEEPSDGA
ncbi:MAG: hypothetical protein RLZZ303_1628 [Candidatus Hydrogenedentota bacterium]|jgi:4-amino-4-deoxy-L-arabinose transferase-like glycosyltransferase